MVKKASYPSGIPYIIGNEAAERFSYYGMKTILVVFMTQYLLDSSGALSPMSEGEAKTWFHVFGVTNYFFPIVGALISDIFWGKYKTIISLSIVYCLGHLTLALFETRFGLGLGLALIAIGSGGIKPCVSAHVGDQFTKANDHLLEKIFAWFYFSINLGAFVSSLLTPVLLEVYGPSVAFGVPGVLMFIATIAFWMGRKVFIAIPPVGWKAFKKDAFSREGRGAILKLSVLYVFISVFWSLFDQTGSSWILQAEKLDREVWLPILGNTELLSSQIFAANPILVMLFIPLFTWGFYPIVERFFRFGPLRRIACGMILSALSFVIIAVVESWLQAGQNVSVLWQLFAYIVLTAGEVMVSITALEFSYTQAPNVMKSIVMGLFFLSVSLGNGIAALVNFLITNQDGTSALDGAAYFYFFVWLMVGTTILFSLYARFYTEKRYIQES